MSGLESGFYDGTSDETVASFPNFLPSSGIVDPKTGSELYVFPVGLTDNNARLGEIFVSYPTAIAIEPAVDPEAAAFAQLHAARTPITYRTIDRYGSEEIRAITGTSVDGRVVRFVSEHVAFVGDPEIAGPERAADESVDMPRLLTGETPQL